MSYELEISCEFEISYELEFSRGYYCDTIVSRGTMSDLMKLIFREYEASSCTYPDRKMSSSTKISDLSQSDQET